MMQTKINIVERKINLQTQKVKSLNVTEQMKEAEYFVFKSPQKLRLLFVCMQNMHKHFMTYFSSLILLAM